MRPRCTKAVHDLLLEVTTPGSRQIYADVNRTDVYVPDGTEVKPYKVAEDAVLAANLLATAASPVHIHLAPGTYNEDSFSLSPYVKLQGSGWGTTILVANDLNNHFITLGAASVIRDVNIWGPTLATKACIYHAAADTRPVVVADVTISRGYYGFYSYPVASDGLALLENFTFTYAASSIQSLVRAEGHADVKVTTSLVFGPDSSVVRGWEATGSDAIVTLVDCFHKVGNSVGVYCDNGAWMRVVSCIFSRGTTAIECGPNGAPNIRAEGTLIHRTLGGGYTNDLKLGTINASIHYTGRCSRDRVDNTAGGELRTFGMNDFTGEEGGMVLGELSVGAGEAAVLPMISYGRDAYLSGRVSGGAVTRNAGRVLDVAGGVGYINDGVNPIQVTWNPDTVTIAAGATEYIYVDAAGAVQNNAVQPPYATNIVLAQAIADATDIVALTRDEIDIAHSLSRLQEYLEDNIGPLCVSAANVTMSGTALKLVLAAGEFAVGLSERDVTGSSPVTFTPVWRNGGGGWTFGAPTDTVDVDHYDNNTGTPAHYPGADHYKRDSIVVMVSDDGDEVFLVYGQNAFADVPTATAGASNILPDMLQHYGMHAADVISNQGAAALDAVIDMRPFIGQNAPVTAAVAADHDLLINLDHDTHLQYLTSGRAVTWLGTQPGNAVNLVDNGNNHDHVGGDGAQIDHTTLSNIGTRTHLQLESDIAANVATVTGTAPIVSSGGTSPAISITAATPAAAGSMSAADKTKLNSMTAGAAVASVSGTAPIVSSGGTTPAISITAATTIAAGSMSAADKAKLDGIAAGATANIFGNGYQTAVSLARSTWNADTLFQTKVSMTTAALPAGTYRVGWTATVDQSSNAREVECQLYNVTDAGIVGDVDIYRPPAGTTRKHVSCFAEVVFAGVAKTFEIQYRTSNVAGTAGIADARIEIWRVA